MSLRLTGQTHTTRTEVGTPYSLQSPPPPPLLLLLLLAAPVTTCAALSLLLLLLLLLLNTCFTSYTPCLLATALQQQ